ncbi:hypothetical protein PG989_008673 [Apiospora arundinis]
MMFFFLYLLALCVPKATHAASHGGDNNVYVYYPPFYPPFDNEDAMGDFLQKNPEAYCETMSSKILSDELPTPTGEALKNWLVDHAVTATTTAVAETDLPTSLRGDWCNFDSSRAHWYTAYAIPLANQCAGRTAFPTPTVSELKRSPYTTTSAWCGSCFTCTANAAVPRQTGDAMMAGALAIGGAVLGLL